MPPLRRITKIYTGALAAAGLSLLVAGLVTAPRPSVLVFLAIVGLIACVAISLVRPLKFEYQAQTNLDTAVLIIALLLLEPGYALLVAAFGGAIANIIRRRTWPEALFNAS